MLLVEGLLGLIAFLLGAALFSFMNVVAWRLPRGKNPLTGRSFARNAGLRSPPGIWSRCSAGYSCAGGAATAGRPSRCATCW